MAKTALRKEKWTLSFDARLKHLVVKAARRRGIYPGNLLEDIVRERFNPYGFTDVKNSVAYLRQIRRKSQDQSDEAFLAELRAWQKSRSS